MSYPDQTEANLRSESVALDSPSRRSTWLDHKTPCSWRSRDRHRCPQKPPRSAA